jgi:hypothetical protein
MDVLQAIVKDPAVWSAVILLATLVARYVVPDLPADLLNAIVALVVVVLGAAGIKGVTAEVKRVRAMREANAVSTYLAPPAG